VILPEEYPNVMDALRERHAAACADRDGRVGRAGERLAELRARLIAIDAEINIESVLAADRLQRALRAAGVHAEIRPLLRSAGEHRKRAPRHSPRVLVRESGRVINVR
jgi:hypothetical protein